MRGGIERGKKVLKGWVGKQELKECTEVWGDVIYDFPHFFRKRGKRRDWAPDQWPPVKVKIVLKWED